MLSISYLDYCAHLKCLHCGMFTGTVNTFFLFVSLSLALYHLHVLHCWLDRRLGVLWLDSLKSYQVEVSFSKTIAPCNCQSAVQAGQDNPPLQQDLRSNFHSSGSSIGNSCPSSARVTALLQASPDPVSLWPFRSIHCLHMSTTDDQSNQWVIVYHCFIQISCRDKNELLIYQLLFCYHFMTHQICLIMPSFRTTYLNVTHFQEQTLAQLRRLRKNCTKKKVWILNLLVLNVQLMDTLFHNRIQKEIGGPAHSWKKLKVIVGRRETAPGTTWKANKFNIISLDKHLNFLTNVILFPLSKTRFKKSNCFLCTTYQNGSLHVKD